MRHEANMAVAAATRAGGCRSAGRDGGGGARLECGREEEQEERSDVADGDLGNVGADDAGAIGEPESEPEAEPPDAKAKPGVGAEDNASEAGSADDGAGPAEAALPVLLPQEVRPSLEQYRDKWARLLAQHSKRVEGIFRFGIWCRRRSTSCGKTARTSHSKS